MCVCVFVWFGEKKREEFCWIFSSATKKGRWSILLHLMVTLVRHLLHRRHSRRRRCRPTRRPLLFEDWIYQQMLWARLEE